MSRRLTASSSYSARFLPHPVVAALHQRLTIRWFLFNLLASAAHFSAIFEDALRQRSGSGNDGLRVEASTVREKPQCRSLVLSA